MAETAAQTAAIERRRPALVLMFTLQQLILLAVLSVLLGGGIVLWMTQIAQYQAISADRLDALGAQVAIMHQTFDAHIRIIQADNAAFLFYARAVCEQVAVIGKQSPALCRTDTRIDERKLP